jgi:hypothetical protein
LEWSTDTGISRLGAGSLAVGNGTASNTSGSLSLSSLVFPAVNIGGALTLTTSGNHLTFTGASGYFFTTGTTNGLLSFQASSGNITLNPDAGLINVGVSTGISRLAAASLAIGNGTAGDKTGLLTVGTGTYNNTTGASIPSFNFSISGNVNATGLGALGSGTSSTAIFLELDGYVANVWDIAFGTTLCNTQALGFSGGAYTARDISLTRISAGLLGLGTGAYGDSTGTLSCGKILLSGSTDTIQIGTGGGLAVTLDSSFGLRLYNGEAISFSAGSTINTGDTGISRLGAASLAIGNGTAGDFSGTLKCATVNATTSYQANGTPGVTQTAIAVGTIATIEGIVTTFTGVSDERLKNHAPYTGGLEEILGITPIRFTYNELGQKFGGWDKEHVYVGFSAQNVQKSIPEAIQGTEGEEEYLSFDDRPVIAALVNAVKELTKRIKSLESKQQGEQLC